MFSIKTVSGMFIGLSLVLGACGPETDVKLDATDGVTLDSTFNDAIAGYEKDDQFKAAAGLLIYAYEGANADTKLPRDYINESKEEALFLLDPKRFEKEVYDTQSEVMDALAKNSNGILNGKTAQDLIDHYNLATE